jgi:hypothetical protein
MRGDKLTKKWKLIKLSRMRQSDFAVRFVEEVVVNGHELYEFALKYGREKGAEVRRNLSLQNFYDVVEFLRMMTGVRAVKEGEAVTFEGCPAREMTDVRRTEVCKGFLEGFFAAFGFDVSVNLKCGERCVVNVEVKA